MKTQIFDRLIELLVIFLIIFTPLAFVPLREYASTVVNVTAMLLFMFWVAKMIYAGKITIVKTPLNLLILSFLLLGILQIFGFGKNLLYIPSTSYQYPTIIKILDIISLSIIFWVVLNNFTRKGQINRILTVIIFMGFSLAFLCILQYLSNEGKTFLGVKPMYSRSRFYGSYINGNHFAAYLGMICPLTIGMGLAEVKKSKKFLFWFIGIIITLGLLFSLSSGGIVSFIGAIGVLFILLASRKSTKKGKWIVATILCFVIAGVMWLGVNPVKKEASQLFKFNKSISFQSRLPIWKASLQIVKRNFLFGTGLGTFRYVFPKFRPPGINREFRYVHNDYLEILLDTGIVGFLILFLGGVYYFRNALRKFYKRKNPYVLAISCGSISALVSMLLHSFVDFNLQIGPNAILFILISALTIQVLNLISSSSSFPLPHKNKYSSSLVGEGRVRGNNLIVYNIPSGWKKSLTGGITAILSVILIIMSIKPALAQYYYNRYISSTPLNPLPRGERIGRGGNCRRRRPNLSNLKKATNLNKLNSFHHYRLSLEYLKKKPQSLFIKDSLKEIKQAISLNPTNARYHLTLAWLYGQLADLPKPLTINPQILTKNYTKLAHQEFQQAIYLEPNTPYGYKIYADWLFAHPTKKNIEKGINEYRKALILKPDLIAGTLEFCYERTKDYDLLSKIIPDTIDGHLALRKYFLEKGLGEKLLKEEEIILDKLSAKISSAKDKKAIYVKAGQIYYNLGKFNEAIVVYHKAIDLGLQDSWTYYRLADSYRKLSKIELAIKYFKISSELDKDNSWPYYSLARIYQSLGKENEAKTMWQKITNLKKPDLDAKRIAKRELER